MEKQNLIQRSAPGPLELLLQEIQSKRPDGKKLTQRDICRRIDIREDHLSAKLKDERRGMNAPPKLINKLRLGFEYLLTGKVTIVEPDEHALFSRMATKIIELEATIDLLTKKLCEVSRPANPVYELEEFRKARKEEFEKRLSAIRS